MRPGIFQTAVLIIYCREGNAAVLNAVGESERESSAVGLGLSATACLSDI